MSTVYEPAVEHRSSEEVIIMTRLTLYTALLALFVGGSVAVPLQAQTREEYVPAAQNEPVTVRVTNDSWSDMRI